MLEGEAFVSVVGQYFDVCYASSTLHLTERTLRFNGTTDANLGYTASGHGTHDLGMAMDLGINDYISYSYQGQTGVDNTPAITIPVGTVILSFAISNQAY